MNRMTALVAGAVLLVAAGTGCARRSAPPANPDAGLWTVYAEVEMGPGNVTVTPRGEVIVSTHQFYEHDARVVRVGSDGTMTPWPNAEIAIFDPDNPASLDSVLGIQTDTEGVVWMLDNGMREQSEPKLVGWNTRAGRLEKIIPLPPPASVQGSFLNDLAVDRTNGFIYIADPTIVDSPALIVVNIETGEARRVLEGRESVTAEEIDLHIEGRPLMARQLDGSYAPPHVGVNPIALDAQDHWLYFGPMHAHTMYRVRTADLRNPEKTSERLARRVEEYSWKPVCDGISIDEQGNIYVTDLARNTIGVIRPDRTYGALARSRRFAWPDAFSFGPDGQLYVVINQLHRSAALNAGEDVTEPPFLVVRMTPVAPGVVGR